MIGRDVEQDGDVGAEVVHVVKLERTELDDIILVRIFCYLKRKAAADVTGQSGIVACFLEDVVDERGRCRLAVGAGDTDHL